MDGLVRLKPAQQQSTAAQGARTPRHVCPLPQGRLQVVVSKHSPHLHQLGIDPEDTLTSGELHISALWLSMNLPHVRDLKSLRWCGIATEDMSPTIDPYDLALVDESVHRIEVPGVYLIQARKGPTLRRVARVDALSLTLTADNKALPTEVLLRDEADVLRVHGRVLWVWNGRRL